MKFDFSPDGRLIAIGTMDGVILICERATGREITRFTGGVNIQFSVAFAQAGRRLFRVSEPAGISTQVARRG